MKNFLKISGYFTVGLIVFAYAAFLLILPRAIDLNQYKPEIQKLVSENSGLNFDSGEIKIVTTPLLEAGIKIKNPQITLPDGSKVFDSEYIRTKVFLPALLGLHVYVSEAKIKNPNIKTKIINGEQYDAIRVYEDFVNSRRKDHLEHPEKYENQQPNKELPFDISKIKVSAKAKLKNYNIVVNDPQIDHKLTLKGEELKLEYHNGKSAKLKTNSEFFSGNDKNITAHIDIDTFLPKISIPEKEPEDYEAVFSLPFVNPVSTYRDYELKSNIDSKLKLRKTKKQNKIRINGFANVENTTLKLSDLQLPDSYFRLKSRGTHSHIDTSLYVTDTENLKIFGDVDYGKRAKSDISIASTQIHLANLLEITKAYLDSAHINNELKDMKADGYFFANAHIKTNKKDIESEGKVIVRKGKIANKAQGVLFDDINANLLFDEDALTIKDTHLLINNRPLKIEGEIDKDSIADFSVSGDKIPLTGLYYAFIPREIKNKYLLNSGYLTLNAKIRGEINNLTAFVRSNIENIDFRDKSGEFIIANKNLKFGLAAFKKNIRAGLFNQGFVANFPKRHSVIADDELKIGLNNNKITLKPTKIKFNRNSVVMVSGGAAEVFSNINALFSANGKLSSADLAEVLLHTAIPYFDVKGDLPLQAKCNVKGNKIKAGIQIASDPNNYITPVNMDNLVGKQTIFQLAAEKNKNTLKILNSGVFVRSAGQVLSDNLQRNIRSAKEIVKVRGIISNISSQPFISLIKIVIPQEMNGSVYILKKSRFTLGGNLHIFGKPQNPVITGKISLKKLSFPELLTTMERVIIDLGSKRIIAKAFKINANNNDISIIAASDWNKIGNLTFTNVKIFSRYIDVNKILKVPEAGEKAFPGSAQEVRDDNGNRPENPVKILNGNLKLNKIVMDNLTINDTSSDLKMYKSTVFLNKLKTKPFGGSVSGDVTYNILSSNITAKVSGQNFDIEKVLLDVMNMKDMLSGDANFIADISLEGTDIEQQLKTLKGYIDFNVKNGQLGPFGKIENFIMAENIRENAFFSSTIGSVITNLVTFDTSRFNSLFGHLTFENGIVNISPIKSQGNVMSMYIQGTAGLLDNTADMKVRVKLASAFSDKLGPLANINPVNLIKNTPGLNIVAAKMFALFCEEVSEEEMKAIPELGEGKSDDYATKLQIKLRGDTRKPLKMIKSFKWLALDSEIQSAKDFVDTIPTPEAGEENMTVEELIELRKQQAQEKAQAQAQARKEAEAKKPLNRIKKLIKKEAE